MKFVDDLLCVEPEDIKHTDIDRATVVSIVHCPDATAYKEVVVVFSDGMSYSYSREGMSAARMPATFIFKAKKINMSTEIEVYKCKRCDFISLQYDSGHPFVKTHERVIDCRGDRCQELDIPLWGVTTFDLKIEQGEGLE